MKKKSLFLIPLVFSACVKTPLPPDDNFYESALFILNEGAFTGGTATIDAIGVANDSNQQQVFSTVNGYALGNIGQHMITADSLLVVSVNNGGVVRGISRNTMIEQWSTLISAPRYLGESSEYIVVTNWGSNYLKILNKFTGFIQDSINVFGVSEQVHVQGDVAYVGLNGGFSNDNRVAIVDLNTKSVDTVVVGDKPNSFVQLGADIYVLCSGFEDWSSMPSSTAASLWKINNGVATEIMSAPTNSDHAIELKTDGTDLYFLNASYSGAVVKSNSNPASWPTAAITPTGAYNLDLINNVLFVHDAKDFASEGTIYQYDLNGNLLDSLPAGIIPRQVLQN
ncbi:MAG: hypothetical protein C7N14_07825 [Bacteroidetes bacterium]|nr:MAG: hypothetical protein C7N14_07825 [Bacteroidota bacterium]